MLTATEMMMRALLLMLMLGGIAGFFTGMVLVMRPGWLTQASKLANHWVSTRRIERLLDQVVKLDRWFYRRHRASGVLMLAGVVFLVYFFIARFDRVTTLAGLSSTFAVAPVLAGALLDAMVLGILLGAVFVMIASLFLLFRPSMLRGFEEGANQWISLRRALKPLEIPRFWLDDYVLQHVRLTGVLLLFGSLYALAGLAMWLNWG